MEYPSKAYNVKIVREPGKDPLTGIYYEKEEQSFIIEAPNLLAAYLKSQKADTIVFRGQLRRTYIDGKEYFDERY